MILRDPTPIKVIRGGPGTGWANPDADHHVYEYRSDPDPNGPLWSRELRPRHRKYFLTRAGNPALVPTSGDNDRINSAQDQFTPGIIEVDGVVYSITADGIEETEKPTMPMKPYYLVMDPDPVLYLEEPAGKSYRIGTREDLEALSMSQLFTLFRAVLPKERQAHYKFPNKNTGADYVWNAWLIIIPKILHGAKPSPEVDLAQDTKPVARTVRKKEVDNGEMDGKVLTRTPLGIGAKRKAGTRRTESWNVIRDGMTYAEYIVEGGSAEDLNIILRLGHATLELA